MRYNWLRRLALALVPAGCSTQPRPPAAGVLPSSRFTLVVDSLVAARMARDSVPGLVVAIVDSAAVITRGYGFADVAARLPMTDTSLLNVASVSKPVTALVVMRLVERGAFFLDDAVNARLRRWQIPSSNEGVASEVTIRRVLMHTAGLSMPSVPCFPLDSMRPDLGVVLEGRAGDRGAVTIVKRPGAAWSYSGGGFSVLQAMIEDLSSRSLDSVARAELFQPLGMSRTTFDPVARGLGTVTPYYEHGGPARRFRCVGEAAGGLYSTARDMALLLRGLFASMNAAAGGLLRASSIDALAAQPVPVVLPGVETGGAAYGLGHMVRRSTSGQRILFHSGGNPGAVAYLIYALDQRRGLFVAANSERAIGLVRELVAQWGAHNTVDVPVVF